MSSINSTSTNAQVWASYDDNASFEEDGSTAKAQAFITACVILLRRRPSQVMTDQQTVSFDGKSVQMNLTRARRWLAAQKQQSVIYQDFSGLRD